MALTNNIRTTDPVTRRVNAYAACLTVIAAAMAVGLLHAGQGPGPVEALIALSLLSAVAERGRVRLNSNTELSISLLPMLFAAVAFGALPAMIVGAASLIGDFRRPYLKWLVFTTTESITAGVTGLAAAAAASAVSGSISSIAAATIVGALTSQVLDAAFASLTFLLRGLGRPLDVVKMLAPVMAASVPLYTPVVALLVVAYREVSPWTLPLFLVPALAAHRLFALYQEQRRLAEDLFEANAHLEHANLSFAAALVATLDARDRYTAGHSAAVAIYARDIAQRMNLSPDQQQLAHLCGLVHDVGKVGLPPGLLEKEGPLSLDERRQMQLHPEIGERILANVDDYAEIAKIVRHHHERVDGNGFPDGLGVDEIPLLSRIIAVADAYNAMTSDRPYRDAMPSRVARLRLAQAVESQFDTSVVAAFEAVLTGADEDYRTARRTDFNFYPLASESAVDDRVSGAA